MKNFFLTFFFSFIYFFGGLAQELIVGEEKVDPGIKFIFEGAIKDVISPSSRNLSEELTNVHIEARVNWDNEDIPDGAVPGGFIPYLRINSLIINESTGLKTFIDLIPHINLIDNFHYARNISLPGKIDDYYKVEFTINPPSKYDLSYHKDWINEYGEKFFLAKKFTYRNINFKEIAKATRY